MDLTNVAEQAVGLRNGETVTIRGVRRRDAPAIESFLAGLCLEARRLRFFTAAVDLDVVARTVGAPGLDRLGVLALDRSGAVVGHAVCIELGGARAEVAVEVADRLHGQGLGTILVGQLAQVAEQLGITSFEAQVLPENRAMLDVFRDGFDARVALVEGTEVVEFPTGAWRAARERYPELPPPRSARDLASAGGEHARPARGETGA
jgi:GNAT superfamily N-acetyltransferase